MNKKTNKFIYAGLAAAVLLTSSMIPQVQVGANKVISNFLQNEINNDKYSFIDLKGNKDMKNAEIFSINEKITDNDITVHLTEIAVAKKGVIIHFRMENKDGELIPYEFNTEGLDLKYDGKENGIQIENPEYYDGNIASKDEIVLNNKGNQTSDRRTTSQLPFIGFPEESNDFTLFFNGKSTDDIENIGVTSIDKPEGTIAFIGEGFEGFDTLEVNINRIGAVKGSWKAQINLKELTK